MTKLQRFLDGFDAIYNAIYFRFDLQDNIDRCAFFYEINIGWYDMYHPENGDERDPWNYLGGITHLKVPQKDYDIPTHGLDKLIKKLQHQMEEHK